MVMLVGVFALGGCDEVDSEAGAIKPPAYSIALPRRIQPRALPSDCADNISGSIRIDDEAPVAMEQQGDSLTWSVTLQSLPLGRHRFEVIFSCTSPAYGAVTLARAEQQVDLVAGANNISFPESLFVFDDLDGDGVANLKEIENGTNPLPSSDIDANPAIAAVLPADGAVGLDPVTATEIHVRFTQKLAESSIDENSVVLVAQGKPVEGDVHFDVSQNAIVFTPESPLGLATEYTATLSRSVSTASGVPISDEDMRWTFTTRDGRWQSPTSVSGQPDSRDPAVAANEDGDAITIWVWPGPKASNQIWSRNFNHKTQLWEELNQVTDPEKPQRLVIDLTVKLSDRGVAIVAWSGYQGRGGMFKVCSSVSNGLEKWYFLDCFMMSWEWIPIWRFSQKVALLLSGVNIPRIHHLRVCHTAILQAGI